MLNFHLLDKMVKLENKDLLLARVWHSYRAYPNQLCMLGVGYLWPH
jgi:hypothetical protein